ncbi:MAG TPA: NAD(P)H-dependent oxidoreductase [Polyangiaceae bacterium]
MKLLVIAVSTRPARVGFPIAQWAFDGARRHGGFEASLADLAAVNLPLFDEPEHPRFRRYSNEHTKRWSALVEPADAYLFVTAEYDYSAPPSLTNALAYLSVEWAYKPVAFVSYGGIAGGTRSVQMAKLTMTALKMMPIPDGVILPMVARQIENGAFTPSDGNEKALAATLTELARWAAALQTMRA